MQPEIKQSELDDEGLLEKIRQYSNMRKEEFWGGLFGYKKCEKVNAAEALSNLIEKPNKTQSILRILPHLGALNDGRLKTCWNLYIQMYPQQLEKIQAELIKLNNQSIKHSP